MSEVPQPSSRSASAQEKQQNDQQINFFFFFISINSNVGIVISCKFLLLFVLFFSIMYVCLSVFLIILHSDILVDFFSRNIRQSTRTDNFPPKLLEVVVTFFKMTIQALEIETMFFSIVQTSLRCFSSMAYLQQITSF